MFRSTSLLRAGLAFASFAVLAMAPRSTLGANPFFIVGRDEATGATFVRTPTACPTSFVEPIDLFGFVSPR